MDKPEAMQAGENLALNLTGVIKSIESENTDTDVERNQFWAGLMGTLIGQMAYAVGPDATVALTEATKPMIASLVKQRAH